MRLPPPCPHIVPVVTIGYTLVTPIDYTIVVTIEYTLVTPAEYPQVVLFVNYTLAVLLVDYYTLVVTNGYTVVDRFQGCWLGPS